MKETAKDAVNAVTGGGEANVLPWGVLVPNSEPMKFDYGVQSGGVEAEVRDSCWRAL